MSIDILDINDTTVGKIEHNWNNIGMYLSI
jgi:hypothetical protein